MIGKFKLNLSKFSLKNLIGIITIIASFSLIHRTGSSIKIFDFSILLLGIIIIFDQESRIIFKKIRPYIWPYLKYLFIIVALIILAQTISYLKNENSTFNTELFTNYGRLIFNIYTLCIISFIVYSNKKLLKPISLAIFLSILTILPAFFNLEEGKYISGGRLTGFLQTPLILGLWLIVAFLLGLSLFISIKKIWLKIFLFLGLTIAASFLLWSASRAAWLALIFSLILWIFVYFLKKDWQKIKTIFFVSIITFILGYTILPHQQIQMKSFVKDRAINFAQSLATIKPQEVRAQSQTRIWPGVINFIIQRPLGSGFGSYYTRQLELKNKIGVSNNTFLELGLYGGLGVILIFLIFLFKLAKQSFQIIKSNLSEISLVWILSGLAVITDIFFTDAFLWRHIWFTLGIILGIILAESELIDTPKNSFKKSAIQ